MTGSTTRVGSKGQRLILTLLLVAIAPLLNLTHIPLLFDVYLIFGSIATMTAVMLLGTPAAVLVAVSGSLVTLFLWGHPYALLIFSLEALCVGLCHRYWNLNLVLADMLYWVVAGMPLVGIFYYFGLDNDSATTALIALKQPLNGVLNALLAVILVLALEALARSGTMRPLRSSRFEFSEVLFISLLLGIALAGTLPIVVEGARDQVIHEQFTARQLQEHARTVTHLLEQEPEQSEAPLTRKLAIAQTSPDFGIALLGNQGQVIASIGAIRSLAEEGGDIATRANGLSLWQPYQERHALKQWQQGSYLTTATVQNVPGVDQVLVEYPAAPVVEQLRTNQLQLLAILFVIIMLGVPAAYLFSFLLTRPLAKLTRSSHGLTRQITSGELPQLPDSMLAEYNELSHTLSEVTRALTNAFREINRSQDTLRQTVAEKTTELSHANTLLNSVLDSATEISIIATDTRGTISVFNHGAERLLGYHADELVGKCTPLAFHDADEVTARAQELGQRLNKPIEDFTALIGVTADGGAEIRNWTYIHKNGQRIPVSLMVTAIRDGNNELTGYLGIALDISERQRMDTLKDEFISTVSHELRTPLTSISGALALVRNGTLGHVPDSMRQMLNIAENNAKRLILLVNDLLDIQKIASGHLHFHVETCALPPLLDEAIEQNQPYGRKRGVTVELMGPIPDIDVSVDRVRLIQALSNLLSNAIKFSPDDCPVEVRAEQDGDELTIAVIDQGAGIPDHFHHRIFQKFAQADSSDARQKGGTGLGLAITRELIEQMGGWVTFETSPTAGTRFYIRLPLATGASATTSIPAPTEPAPRQVLAPATIDTSPTRPLVLHVEDDADLIDVMRVAAGNRFELHFATSLAAAREQLQHPRRYQLVLLDIGLPDGSGWQLLPEIYRQQPQANVVILSGQHLSRQELDLVEATFTKSQASIDILLSTLETLTSHPSDR
ncbi:ATP-binding protein [Marinobacter zhejiangensis]|uniref:histidine kinase n=1 Tax=Marinobacter zhejiangensis TaxID=488535 RepID=A0A1I4M9A5_9GAMM|nr:ATP-binding protein [Marinobacter zhejiangensis]SFL99789.1 PAS domain S-box-containing protein [Marinobacter zhejiangensis]